MKPSTTEIARRRCAIYTRKSTDEGLDQEFNSLDAQREAGEFHVRIHADEGWELLPDRYDDGGYSGGTMERPALQRLIRDIKAGLIDVVIVHRIDRLSRWMRDYFELLDLFEKHKVSFVSVTQSFDTGTAMGRLILNILQSFSQFERDMTTERIRDKVSASKQKGIWMGGPPPLGYDVRNRKLEVNPDEAEIVQFIFNRFAKIASTTELLKELREKGYETKTWVSATGIHRKGKAFQKNALYKILGNPTYIGKVHHKGNLYDGEHVGIIEIRLWEKVRAIITARHIAPTRAARTEVPALLRGLLVDPNGYALTPAASKKQGKTYRYYVSTRAVKTSYAECPLKTISAGMLEEIVVDQVKRLLSRPEWAVRIARQSRAPDLTESKIMKALKSFETLWDELFPAEQRRILSLLIDRIQVHPNKLLISLKPLGMASLLQEILPALPLGEYAPDPDEALTIELPVKFRHRGNRKHILAPDGRDIVSSNVPRPDPGMIKAVSRGHKFLEMLDANHGMSTHDIAEVEKLDQSYVAKFVRMTQLAPDIIEAILNGRQPKTLSLAQLQRTFPDAWADQRKHFGFGGASR